jgi:hypothetical protein
MNEPLDAAALMQVSTPALQLFSGIAEGVLRCPPACGVRQELLADETQLAGIGKGRLMKLDTVIYEQIGNVARLTLNRPERVNAINQQMLHDLDRALDIAEADPAIRVIVVTGSGTAFSSGFDLKEQMELILPL